MAGVRWRTVPVELLVLAFLGVFLVYPLAYILPNAASDEDYAVVLRSLPEEPEAKARVAVLLAAHGVGPIRLPHTVAAFPNVRVADTTAKTYRDAGCKAEVVPQRRWTLFYFRQALGVHLERVEQFPYVSLVPNSPSLWQCLMNSLAVAAVTTLATTLLCLPLAQQLARYNYPGQALLSGLLLVPLVLPPFVGAIGLEHLLGRFGTVNLLLMKVGLLDPGAPIDWLGGSGFIGVVVMQVLHLYPVLYLNLAAARANIDPTLEDAARNLGAGEWRVFRTVTFPLLLPGYFAGASLVFVWAFTDLGTPLVFQWSRVLPVQIFDQVSDPQRTNPVAYALVVITLFVSGLLFYLARWALARGAYIGGGKGAVATAVPNASRTRTILVWTGVAALTLLAALPHFGVVLTSLARRWVFTPLPSSYTTAYFSEVWSNHVAATSIRNSLLYSAAGTALDLVLGVTVAWLVVRRPSWLTNTLDGLVTLPLALPGLVLAFGYLTCYGVVFNGLSSYTGKDLSWMRDAFDPVKNPVPLLIVAYAIRRLPYVARSAQAGLQQVPPVLEEAAENLGASRWRVTRTVTVPLIAANVIAGAVLTFAFAILEVSDSLMLVREEKYYPITRALIGILLRPDDGDRLASALGVVAMALLGTALLGASLLLGRRLGQLFRAAPAAGSR
jgi:iron(III) transport system permease protein